MKKFWKFIFKLIKKLIVIGLVGFVATFALYMFNGENKLIYYVVRPLLNKHYDSQVRDRRIV
jgi:replication initiation and membrane attachment protein DnaB